MFRLKISRRGLPNGGPAPCFWNSGGNRSRGVGLVCNVSLDFEDLEVKRDFHGRLINVKLSLHNWQFQICVSMLLRRIGVLFRLMETHVPPGYLCF